MNCPSTQQWNLLSMNLLEQADAADLFAHAQACDACQAALRQARQDHALLLQSCEVFNRRHNSLREQLMAAIPAELPPRTLRWRGRWIGLPDFVRTLDTPARRVAAILAPAACILIAVGLFAMLGRGTVAFATVLERMRQARTMVCDTITTVRTEFNEAVVNDIEQPPQEQASTPIPAERTTRARLSMYSDGTTAAWRLDQIDPPSTQWIFPDRTVTIDADGERTVIEFAKQPNPYARCESPEWWLSRLLKLSETPDRELGEKTIDGRSVVGFEIAGWKLGYGARPAPGSETTTAATAAVRLWVDTATCLPVRMAVENVMAMRMPGLSSMSISMTWDHMEWDVPLDLQTFHPPAPVASEPVEGEEERLDASAPTEEALLDGLRTYAAEIERIRNLLGTRLQDLSQLRQQEWPDDPEAQVRRAALDSTLEVLECGYPRQLDQGTILQASIVLPSQVRANLLAARASGDHEALAQAEHAEREFHEEFADFVPRMQAMLVFYRQLLVEDREPGYFGATVRPGDSDAVLMRWKLDDGRSRVIYGDLRTETVATDGETGNVP